MTNVFIISLPRSGSTLLQRILVSHQAIASVAEPWILLPFASISEYPELKTYSEYSYRVANIAYSDFLDCLPRGKSDYYDCLSQFLRELYGKACSDDASFFLDKTPRYYLIVDYIKRLFPDSKLIFLVRNPLEVVASMIDTWWGGRLWINHQHIDLYRGPQCVHDAASKYHDSSLLLSYCDLVTRPEAAVEEVCQYLGIDFFKGMLDGISDVHIEGEMGDKTGIKKYGNLSTDSLGRWAQVYNNPVRRKFAKQYLTTLGDDVLSTFGCNREALVKDLHAQPLSLKGSCRDSFGLIKSGLSRKLCLKIVIDQIRSRQSHLID